MNIKHSTKLQALEVEKHSRARTSPENMAKLLAELLLGESSIAELAIASGLSYHVTRRYCIAFHNAKLIHVASYDFDSRGRKILRVYKWGSAQDAKQRKVTNRESALRHYHAKKKQALDSWLRPMQ